MVDSHRKKGRCARKTSQIFVKKQNEGQRITPARDRRKD